jgi:membrane-associated protein
MRFVSFAVATAVSAIVWTDGMLLIGYWLGHFDFVRRNKGWFDTFVLIVVIIGLVPTLVHYLQMRRRRRTG